MIHHMSFAAREPQTAAEAIAALWGGEAFPFPPVGHGSWVAIAGDTRGTTIEVYPAGTELHPAEAEEEAEVRTVEGRPRHGPSHAAIASPLEEAQVLALAARHGWTARRLRRGGLFDVIEFWVEDAFMLEVMTPEMRTGRPSAALARGSFLTAAADTRVFVGIQRAARPIEDSRRQASTRTCPAAPRALCRYTTRLRELRNPTTSLLSAWIQEN